MTYLAIYTSESRLIMKESNLLTMQVEKLVTQVETLIAFNKEHPASGEPLLALTAFTDNATTIAIYMSRFCNGSDMKLNLGSLMYSGDKGREALIKYDDIRDIENEYIERDLLINEVCESIAKIFEKLSVLATCL